MLCSLQRKMKYIGTANTMVMTAKTKTLALTESRRDFSAMNQNEPADRHRNQRDPNPGHDARRPAASQDEFVPKFARLRRALESQDPIANFKVSENFWDVGKRADCSDNAQRKGPFRLPAETTDQESGDKKWAFE